MKTIAKQFLSVATALSLASAFGCSPQPAPKGVGASGKKLEVAPDSVNKVDENLLKGGPGSGTGMGGGMGGGRGRTENPEVAGKAEHEPGLKKKQMEKKAAAEEKKDVSSKPSDKADPAASKDDSAGKTATPPTPKKD